MGEIHRSLMVSSYKQPEIQWFDIYVGIITTGLFKQHLPSIWDTNDMNVQRTNIQIEMSKWLHMFNSFLGLTPTEPSKLCITGCMTSSRTDEFINSHHCYPDRGWIVMKHWYGQRCEYGGRCLPYVSCSLRLQSKLVTNWSSHAASRFMPTQFPH